jgi:hypothetical protein
MNALRRIAALPFMSAPLPGARRRRPLLPVLFLFAAVFGVGEVKSFGQTINMNWSVSEFQPDIKQGGRTPLPFIRQITISSSSPPNPAGSLKARIEA